MPVKKDDTTNYEELEEALLTSRKVQEDVITKYGYRLQEVELAEDDIIETYANSPKLHLSADPSLLECTQVQAYGQNLLNRLSIYELKALRSLTRLENKRRPLINAILQSLGTNGSAETRRAKSEGATEVLNTLIRREEGLLQICETIRKNILRAQDTASRAQTAIQYEVQYLNGIDTARELNESSRKNTLR